MRRPNRIELYREICKQMGTEPHSAQGYFSRREMLELLQYVQQITASHPQLQKDARNPKCRSEKA
jgi:hypothetical protein